MSAFAKMFPTREVQHYLVVGIGNTVFGYACYASFVALYSSLLPARHLPFTADIAFISATLIGVTESFFAYKFLVFRTSGNYFQEWLRCFVVYGGATIPGLFVLPALVKLLHFSAFLHNLAPYLAGAVVLGGTAICTYLAPKNFSFAIRRD